jgi:exosortase
MEHGVLVIPAAAYIVWTKRARLAQIQPAPSIWSIPLLLWGAAQASLGIAAHWVWIGRTALLVSLVGCLVAVYGFEMVRALAYPLSILILMIAPPSFLLERLTLNLQLLASGLGESCLAALGYSVMREGNILELAGAKLSVAEACSGIRSLFSILFVCAVYNYFFVHGHLMRTLLFVMAVPVAILGNVGRIVASGVASQYNQELLHGAAHEAFGYVSVTVAGAGCVALHRVMVRVEKVWQSRRA